MSRTSAGSPCKRLPPVVAKVSPMVLSQDVYMQYVYRFISFMLVSSLFCKYTGNHTFIHTISMMLSTYCMYIINLPKLYKSTMCTCKQTGHYIVLHLATTWPQLHHLTWSSGHWAKAFKISGCRWEPMKSGRQKGSWQGLGQLLWINHDFWNGSWHKNGCNGQKALWFRV